MSACYKRLNEEYPVYVGKGFWHRLTGDEGFYAELINAFAEVADEMDSSALVQQVIRDLADGFRKH